MDVIQFAVLGLGTGAVYGLLAQGLVALYRGSGVLNFAHGAIAMVAAFLFAHLRSDQGLGFWPAAVIAVGTAVLIGFAVHQGVMRPLERGSSLSRVIATLGLLLTFQGAAILIWGNQAEFVDSFLPTTVVSVDEISVGVDRLILLGIAGVVTVGLWAGYRFTTLGLATGAIAENRRAAAALGWSPNTLATLNWGLGAGLAGIAGILISPLTAIQVEPMTMIIIPALAAALIGGLASFPLTLLGAIAIGIGQSLVGAYVDQQGAATAVPFVILVVFLVLRGKALPVRGYVGERLAEVGTGQVRWAVLGPLVALMTVLIFTVFPVDLLVAIQITFAVACVLLSIVVLTGYTGQLSLAQFAIGGIGTFFTARLVVGAGWPLPLAFVAGVLAVVPVGLLFGLPALRTRGVNLAVITLGLGVSVEAMLFNNAELTGGPDGTPVGPQSLFGIDIDPIAYPDRYAFLSMVLFGVCALAIANVRRSAVGRRLIAVRTNERAAAALGISVTGAKLYAFALAAMLATVGGIVLGFKGHTVLYTQFGANASIVGVAYAVVGSIAWLVGPVFGATLFAGALGSWVVHTIFGGSIDSYLLLIGGVSLIFFLLQDPNGLASAHATVADKLVGLVRRRPPQAAAVDAPEPAPRSTPSKVAPRRLTVSEITVRFGGVTAVDGVSLSVVPGQITGLIGPNGAGKTTVIDAVTGFVDTATGSIEIDGVPIDAWPVHKRAREGISRSFQSLELFDDVTVLENLRVASDRQDPASYFTELVASNRATLPPAAVAAIEDFELAGDLAKRPRELPYGRRRLAAVARAVAGEPSILLLDEPAAGLDAEESAELADFVRRVATTRGIGILVVEHNMPFVMRVCDHIHVLDFGRTIATGTEAEIRRDPAVIAAYLGGEDASKAPAVEVEA